MSYSLFILRHAQKELSKIPNDIYERIKEAIIDLSENPHPSGSQKLRGRDGWRIRIGDYRIIYEIDEGHESITILHIGHRRDVYR